MGIGGDGGNEKPKEDHKSKNGTPHTIPDDTFFGDMMTNKSATTTPVSAAKKEVQKTETSKPQKQSPRNLAPSHQSQPQMKPLGNGRRSPAATTSQGSNAQNRNAQSRNRQSGGHSKSAKKSRSQQQVRAPPHDEETASGVMVELLLGIQTTLNSLTVDVRKLQNDVNFLKQQHLKNQRR